MNRSKLSYRFTGLLVSASFFSLLAGCMGQPAPVYGPGVVESLQVVPDAALSSAQAGKIDAAFYSESSSDPYLDQTYVIYGKQQFDLDLLNLAAQNQSQIGSLPSGQLQLATQTNDIADASVVVEIEDISKLHSMTVNGQKLLPSNFIEGTPSLPSANCDTFNVGSRLPGYYAIVSVGALPAGGYTPLSVTIDGDCGVLVHLDSYGKAYCSNVLVNSPTTGTTLFVHYSGCGPGPSPSPSVTPSPSPSVTPSPSPSVTPSPSPSVTPSPSPSVTPSPSPSVTPSPSPSVTPSPSPSVTPSPSPSVTPCPSPSVTPTPTPSDSPSPCPTPSNTPSSTPSSYPSWTPSGTPSSNPSGYPCGTPEESGCVHARGYWRDNSAQCSPYLPVWLGGNSASCSVDVASLGTATQVLSETFVSGSGNGISQLYGELLAAQLNLKSGASGYAIAQTLHEVNHFLANNSASSWDALSAGNQQKVQAWTSTLVDFNSGNTGPASCNF